LRKFMLPGVERGLARNFVAQQLMAKDALGAHARDELGISEISTARPAGNRQMTKTGCGHTPPATHRETYGEGRGTAWRRRH
jgi:hypothetical protein